MKKIILALLILVPAVIHAQIPVTDIASITSNQIAHAENIAKWIDSIEQLKTQIDQLKQQVNIQSDLRRWTGDPKAARLVLDKFGVDDLIRDYGQTRASIIARTDSLGFLQNTANGTFRSIGSTDLEGEDLKRDDLSHRRYAVLAAQEENFQKVAEDTHAREVDLQEDLSTTLEDLSAASTDAEVNKQTAKIEAINGQLATLGTKRRDQTDQLVAQKILNDTRIEEERLAAAELEAKNDYLANQRVTRFMKTIKIGKTAP